MKKQVKLVVALALTLMSFTTNAQFKKSEKFAEGTVSYSKTTNVDGEYTFSPTFGYFVTDRFAVGVSGEFGKSTAQQTTGVGVFGRCYMMNVGSKFHIYSQVSLSTTSVSISGNKTSTTNANAGFGANYFVSKNLALSTDVANLIGYTSNGTTSTFSIGFNGVNNPLSAARFGVLYRF